MLKGRRGPAARFEIFTTEISARNKVSARRRRIGRLFCENRVRVAVDTRLVKEMWLRVRAILLVNVNNSMNEAAIVDIVVVRDGEVLGVKAAKYANITSIPPI